MSLKRQWETDDYYHNLFGNNTDLRNPRIVKLRDQLNSLENSPTYDIIGYGSLMNRQSRASTLPSVSNIEVVTICDYNRVFNIGDKYTGSFLNIEYGKDARTICAKLTIPAADMPNYLLREGLYDLIRVNYYGDSFVEKKAYSVISNSTNVGLEPQLNYVHQCLTGIASVAGMRGVDNFLDHSYCYNSKLARVTTLREWMADVNLVDLMIRQDYSSR